MQGSYTKDGLPRPYNMRPVKKKYSPYNKMPQQFFTTPRRKLVGYLIMLSIFGMMIFMVSQDMKAKPDPIYEVIKLDKGKEDLASNLAQAPNGKVGIGLAEAPKGGIANEGVVVGSDEDKIVGRKTRNKNPIQANIIDDVVEDENDAGSGGAGAAAPAGAVKNGANKVKGYKATKNGEEVDKQKQREIVM